jgi:hypothetical protein
MVQLGVRSKVPGNVEPLLKRPAARAAVALALLALLAGTFFWGGLFGHTRTLIGDSADQQFPYLNLVSRLWRHGEVPLWNPFLFNGYPLVAEPQYQTFYPPTLLMSLLTAFSPRAVFWQVVLHQILGGFFTYLLAGLWLRSTPARLLAGLVYMLNGCFWARQQHVVTIDTEIWLPLVLYAVERAYRERTPGLQALAVGALALMLLAGHSQSSYFNLLIIGATTLFLAVEARKTSPGSGAWRPPLVFCAALGVAILLSAVQLLPTWELTRLSNRSGAVPYQVAIASGALRGSHLVTFFLPDFYGALTGPYIGPGDVTQSSVYFGVLPLLLVGFALTGTRQRRVNFLLVMTLLTLLISLGSTGLVSVALYHFLPLFSLFRSPANYDYAFTLFAALLAGCGLEALQRNDVKPARYAVYLAVLGLALVLLVHFAAWPHFGLGDGQMKRGAIVLAAAFAALLVVAALRGAKRIPASVCGWVLLALSATELVIVGRGAMTLGRPLPSYTLCEEDPPPVVSMIGGLPGQGCERPAPPVLDPNHAATAFRLHIDADVYRDSTPVPDVAAMESVGLDRAPLHQLYLTDGYDPIVLRRHVALQRFVRRLSVGLYGHPLGQHVLGIGRVLIGQAVKFVLLPGGLIELPDPLPRTYFVERGRFVSDDTAALEALRDPNTDLRSEVILEDEGSATPPAPARRWEPVRITAQSAASLVLEVDAPRPGYVVYSDTFYPGWEAEVNGRPRPILHANHSFKAVRVEAGHNEVRFRFRPASLRRGATLSLVTLLLGLGALVFLAIRRRAPRART